MELWQSLSGVMDVEVVSADPAGMMHAMETAGISATQLRLIDDFTLRMQIARRDHKILLAVCNRRSETLTICRQSGLYWQIHALHKRPLLVTGLLLLFLFTLWVPGSVFFVQVEGNSSVPTRQILEAAAQCGITFGTSRREVRSEKMKNALLEAMPQLSWAGINTNGCTAVISVREKDVEQSAQECPEVSSIVASIDGVIRELIVLKGTAQCKVGQPVKEGDILISGYTDCGICVQATCASGEIYAQTNRAQSAIMPSNFDFRGEIISTQKKYSLILGKKRVFFTNSSGISDTTCVKIYEEKYLTLPGGFVLPVALAVETSISYNAATQVTEGMEDMLRSYVRAYTLRQTCAGSMESATEEIVAKEDHLLLEAAYVCCEMIGLTRIEENLPNYGKND